jgi:hypothetical protein
MSASTRPACFFVADVADAVSSVLVATIDQSSPAEFLEAVVAELKQHISPTEEEAK